MKRILWLASWYPNRTDQLTGDFIERHAKAVSLYDKITLLFVVKDNSLSAGETFVEERNYNENFSAFILYYRAANKFQSVVKYFSGYIRLVRNYIKLNGFPDLVHVHVVFRSGLIALYLKYRYGLKYIVTEHWSLFNDKAKPAFKDQSFFKRKIIRKIFLNAVATTAVSHHLADSVADKAGVKKPSVIPNVFDASLFFPEKADTSDFRFIHVSQLNYAKNAEQIFEAVAILSRLTNKPFTLTVYGPYIEKLFSDADKKYIDFRGEVPQQELAAEIRKHAALILYSRFEGLPCVVIEAQACGLPVIVSDIPSMHEMVNEKNGIIVPLNDPQLLAEKMLWMMNNHAVFNKGSISAEAADKYSFEIIGKQFSELYDKLID